MANVQLENGYIRIAFDLFNQLFLREFTLKQIRIILLIIRLSYGFKKKEAVIIPKSRFDCANLYKQDIKNELAKLIDANVIEVVRKNAYKINKDFDSWKIPFHKSYNEEKFRDLLSEQFSKQNTNNEVSETLTDEENQKELVSETLTNECVNHLPISEKSKQNTNNEVSETLTKNENLFVNHLPAQAENKDTENNTGIPKDISKDNIKDISKDIFIREPKEKLDPFINPVKDLFTKTYKEVFKVNRIDLSKSHCFKIVELNDCVENFADTIPATLKKLKNLDFDLPNFTANYTWLLQDDNYIKVLAGTYDKKAGKEERKLTPEEELALYNDDSTYRQY